MRWCNTVELQKVTNYDDCRKEFLCQYSCNFDVPITLRDLKLTKQKEKESLFFFLAGWMAKAAHMANQYG